MPAPSGSIDISTLGAVFYHPEVLNKIKGIMLYVGQEINQETTLPGEPPETTTDLAKRKLLIQHFTQAADHWNGVIRTRFAVDPDVAAVKELLPVPFANLTAEQRTAVNAALYNAMQRLVAVYKAQV